VASAVSPRANDTKSTPKRTCTTHSERHCNAPQHTATHCNTATYCTRWCAGSVVSQTHTATHCNTATYCTRWCASVRQHSPRQREHPPHTHPLSHRRANDPKSTLTSNHTNLYKRRCSTHTTHSERHCNTSQHTATHCNRWVCGGCSR